MADILLYRVHANRVRRYRKSAVQCARHVSRYCRPAGPRKAIPAEDIARFYRHANRCVRRDIRVLLPEKAVLTTIRSVSYRELNRQYEIQWSLPPFVMTAVDALSTEVPQPAISHTKRSVSRLDYSLHSGFFIRTTLYFQLCIVMMAKLKFHTYFVCATKIFPALPQL